MTSTEIKDYTLAVVRAFGGSARSDVIADAIACERPEFGRMAVPSGRVVRAAREFPEVFEVEIMPLGGRNRIAVIRERMEGC